MKRTVLSSFLTVGTLVLLGGFPAFGMVAGEIRAKIPFEFRVGSATLPSGEYVIVADAENPDVLEFRNENGSPAILVITQPITRKSGWADQSELQFTRVGTQEYLSRVWESDTDTGNEVSEPAAQPNASTHSGTNTVKIQAVPVHKG